MAERWGYQALMRTADVRWRSSTSAAPVKTHLAHLLKKLGVTSRTEAIKVATRRGPVRLD